MPLPTPPKPDNAFNGAEQSVETQKQALTELLASQGKIGAQLLTNRGEDAGALAAAAKAQYGDAGQPVKALYDTFSRDAGQAQTNQANEMARLQAANQNYMGQVSAAVPLQRQDSDTFLEALRLQFEDRQKQAEQEAAERAASRRASSGSSSSSNALLKALEGRAVDREMAAMDFANLKTGQKRPSIAGAAGAAGERRDIVQAAKDIGADAAGAQIRWVDRNPKGATYRVDVQLQQILEEGIQEAVSQDLDWGSVMADGQALARQFGVPYESYVQPLLAQYSPMWGVKDAEWITSIPRGSRSVKTGPRSPGLRAVPGRLLG